MTLRPALRLALSLLLAGFSAGTAIGQDSDKTGRRVPTPAEEIRASAGRTYGGELQGFDYPYPVQEFRFVSQGYDMKTAFMDVPPEGEANGRTAVLLHGKNFCAATWEGTIRSLAKAGYRVIAPDQIGFCKSTKPRGYQFSFNQLALNTKALLDHLGIRRATVIGHSMGGMLAIRYALSYPDETEQLVLVNPIGLEDWQAKGVPYQSIDAGFDAERKSSADSIRAYQRQFYYGGAWKPEYDRWVDMLAGMNAGPDGTLVAWNQAQTSDMVFTQPVVREFVRIAVPTVLMIGQKDRTAPGANRAPKEIAETLGDYPRLGKAAAALIPGARLVELPGLGHSPQVEAPAEFEPALLKVLSE
ncbi:alpha/beta fold hydrolase [Aureimonas psammosilenae]|uniref:alpha/beta fold hydrolase n=1 Tax=Aureimonas psammosilenae TaxID=2495496 RepID=UPI00126054C4|nr:alpha/beta hydrolase [Aureimonas psammosilenae]